MPQNFFRHEGDIAKGIQDLFWREDKVICPAEQCGNPSASLLRSSLRLPPILCLVMEIVEESKMYKLHHNKKHSIPKSVIVSDGINLNLTYNLEAIIWVSGSNSTKHFEFRDPQRLLRSLREGFHCKERERIHILLRKSQLQGVRALELKHHREPE